ncbi:uncharacterized protein BYT42DRAFT_618598 [Radiomyces spectabilis]|uniref:uncharacterized protein n=1 Tax=Radiomyces spectabilis TaxID=64574 RepID=UPI002220720E|nr:uncharacterized protein BYT42DRAFT_618598 [Radiomyces spectabilis]KAI8365213.1 hypothetical protein BYT42DRAFT_618598 [Radiomyces spectabilis]
MRDRLSTLPPEILQLILGKVTARDIHTVGQINPWLRALVAPIAAEHVQQLTNEDGWRLHIILYIETLSYLESRSHYHDELSLLGQFRSIDPSTLDLHFDLCPMDEQGFQPVPRTVDDDTQVMFLKNSWTTIELSLNFAKVTPSTRRLEYIDMLDSINLETDVIQNQLSSQTTFDMLPSLANHVHVSIQVSESALPEPSEIVSRLALAAEQETLPRAESRIVVLNMPSVCTSYDWWLSQIENASDAPIHDPTLVNPP